jgi:ELWxxDGT repeat protein
MVKDIYPGAEDSSITDMVVIGNVLYFQAQDGPLTPEGQPGVARRGLWRSDETEAGAVLATGLYPGLTGSDPQILGIMGRGTATETLLFSADDYFHGTELWKVQRSSRPCHLYRSWSGRRSRLLPPGRT